MSTGSIMTLYKLRCFKYCVKLLSIFLIILLCSCGDSNGSDGSDGLAGPEGPPGTPASSSLSRITATMSSQITSAIIADDGTLTVSFSVADDIGNGFRGLTTSNIRFTTAVLFPAGTRGVGESTQWQSYINKIESAPLDPSKGSGIEDAIQATYEKEGKLTDNSDGSYRYIFNVNVKNVTLPTSITFNPEYTQRVAFQISGGGFPTMNETYDWQPSTGTITGLISREMVVKGSCNNCHGELAMHGGGRVDTAYCVTCHNPGNKDANSGESLDFKVMVHRIHRGANLPSVVNGAEFAIWGHNDTKHLWNTQLPQDIRNCTNCHDHTISATPDAVNWMNAPTLEACGSCHDNIDFSKGPGEINGHKGGAMADNGECALCHAQGRFSSTFDKHVGVMIRKKEVKSAIVVNANAARVNLTTGDIEVDLMLTLEGAPVIALVEKNGLDSPQGLKFGRYGTRGAENGSLAINWDNGEGYQVNHQEVDLNDCTPDGSGLFTCAAKGLLTGITATDVITTTTVDLFVCMNERDGNVVRCDAQESPSMHVTQVEVKPSFTYFKGDGTLTLQGYNKIGADQASCQGCHADQIFHHGATELGQCKTCHNATRTSNSRGTGDLKRHVHFFHSSLAVNVIDKQGLPPSDYVELVNELPINIDNCNSCHSAGQFDLPIAQNSRASAFSGDKWVSPTAVVCSSCHISLRNLGLIDPNKPGYMENSAITPQQQGVLDHMIQNGAIFGADTFDEANKVESCLVCHAIGAEYGVDKVHSLH